MENRAFQGKSFENYSLCLKSANNLRETKIAEIFEKFSGEIMDFCGERVFFFRLKDYFKEENFHKFNEIDSLVIIVNVI